VSPARSTSCVRTLRGARVVLVGAEDMRSDFEEILSNEVKNHLLGWTTAEAHADAQQLLEAARSVLEESWAKAGRARDRALA